MKPLAFLTRRLFASAHRIGNQRRRRCIQAKHGLAFDLLETRRCLAGIGFSFSNQTLEVTGTSDADRIHVLQIDSEVVLRTVDNNSQDIFTGIDSANVAKIIVDAGAGDDTIIVDQSLGAIGTVLTGGIGNDEIHGGRGDDDLFGGPGNDRLFGHSGIDWLGGSYGDDVLNGGGGNDRLLGHQGADILFGSSGNDSLLGGQGNDSLNGGIGNNDLDGGQDNDLFRIDNRYSTNVTIRDSQGFDSIDLSNWIGTGTQHSAQFVLGLDGLQTITKPGSTFGVTIDIESNEAIDNLIGTGLGDSVATQNLPRNLTVSTLEDEDDGDFWTGDLSLREALRLSNFFTGVQTISYSESLFVSGPQRSTLAYDSNADGRPDELLVDHPVEITGPGAARLLLGGADQTRVVNIESAGADPIAVNISDITIVGGSSDSEGAGIRVVDADLTLQRVRVAENQGSGIYSRNSDVLLNESWIDNNVGEQGGGIRFVASDAGNFELRILNSKIFQNDAQLGGGVYLGEWAESYVVLHVTDSEITSNSANAGGGLYAFAPNEANDIRFLNRVTAIFDNAVVFDNQSRGNQDDDIGGRWYFRGTGNNSIGNLGSTKHLQPAYFYPVGQDRATFESDFGFTPAVENGFIQTVAVGNVGNAPIEIGLTESDDRWFKTGSFGSVSYEYRIGTTEVTNDQYAAFLNAVGSFNTHRIYDIRMQTSIHGGISRSGINGQYTHTVKPNMGDKPVVFVSLWDSMRFINWLHNGMPTGSQDSTTTEDGAYYLGGVTDPHSVGITVARKSDAQWFLPSEDEWFKAAHHKNDGATGNYYAYPTQSDIAPTPATADAFGNVSNPFSNVANYNNAADWNNANGNLTTVGSAGTTSAYGVYDLAGNVDEFTDTFLLCTDSGCANETSQNTADLQGQTVFQRSIVRSGNWEATDDFNITGIINGSRDLGGPNGATNNLGFRVATILNLP